MNSRRQASLRRLCIRIDERTDNARSDTEIVALAFAERTHSTQSDVLDGNQAVGLLGVTFGERTDSSHMDIYDG